MTYGMDLTSVILFAVIACCLDIGVFSTLAALLFETLSRRWEAWIATGWISLTALTIIGTICAIMYDYSLVQS